MCTLLIFKNLVTKENNSTFLDLEKGISDNYYLGNNYIHLHNKIVEHLFGGYFTHWQVLLHGKSKFGKNQKTRVCLLKDRQLLYSVFQLEMKCDRYSKFLTDPGLTLSIKGERKTKTQFLKSRSYETT